MDYRLRDCLLYWRIAEADVVAIDMKKWIACGNCFFFEENVISGKRIWYDIYSGLKYVERFV